MATPWHSSGIKPCAIEAVRGLAVNYKIRVCTKSE